MLLEKKLPPNYLEMKRQVEETKSKLQIESKKELEAEKLRIKVENEKRIAEEVKDKVNEEIQRRSDEEIKQRTIEETKRKDDENYCQEHNLQKTYYCLEISCRQSICAEGFMEKHSKHEWIKLKDIYQESKRIVDKAMLTFAKRTRVFQATKKQMDAQVFKVKEEEVDHETKIKAYKALIIESVAGEKARKVSKIENWTKEQVEKPMEERKEFKAKLEKMTQVDLVNSTQQILN